MRLGPIVLALRMSNTHFGVQVGGAADLDLATRYTLKQDMAFVVPLSEDAEENDVDGSINQILTERFAVVCALANDASDRDKMGLAAYDQLHDYRSEIIKTLVGWDLGYERAIQYRGGRLLAIDPTYLWYQWEFEYVSRVIADEGGFGEIQSWEPDPRKYPWELPDFLRLFAQYIYRPTVKWEQVAEILRGEGKHLPLSATLPDASQWVDLSKPYVGAFNAGFVVSFDRYRENR